MMNALILDFETTNLPKHPSAKINLQPRIIEIGAILVDENGAVLEEMSELVYPEMEISEEITKITGITNEDLAGKLTIDRYLPRIQALCDEAGMMIAHNAPFDTFLLELELRRCGQFEEFRWPKRIVCTVQENIDEWGKRPRMVDLYEHLMGKPLLQLHRALDDCHALLEIVNKQKIIQLYNRMGGTDA